MGTRDSVDEEGLLLSSPTRERSTDSLQNSPSSKGDRDSGEIQTKNVISQQENYKEKNEQPIQQQHQQSTKLDVRDSSGEPSRSITPRLSDSASSPRIDSKYYFPQSC